MHTGVVTNVLICTFFLKEPLLKVNILGVLFIVGGIVTVVVFSPETTIVIKSATFFQDVIATTESMVYFIIFAVGVIIMVPVSYKFGERYVPAHICIYIYIHEHAFFHG
jgi:hypothetical protein